MKDINIINTHIITFGCRLNKSETASLKENFCQNGFKISPESNAHIIVLNTCTVTEKGSQDTYKTIKKLQSKHPLTLIAVIGCLVEAEKNELLKFKNVRWIIGNERKMELPNIIKSSLNHTNQNILVPHISTKSFTSSYPAIDPDLTRANLKIHDGCNSFCSYCIIPYVRGRSRSRNVDDIKNEFNTLVNEGYKEIVLTGINIGNYHFNDKNIRSLLEELIKVDLDFRIRISSIEPSNILYSIKDLIKNNSKICNFLHIPIQSGSDYILNQMNRKYNTAYIKKIISTLKTEVPDICIGTDIITGFPGETDQHFEETYNLIQNLPFSYIHVFSYSKRKKTKSYDFSDHIPENVINKRSRLLRTLSKNKKNKYFSSFINTTQRVLFEQKKQDNWYGLTNSYAKVKIKSTQNLKNKFMNMLITSYKDETLTGKII